MKPSLETMAGLYLAATAQREEGERAVAHVKVCMERHGYALAEVQEAAMKLMPELEQ